MRGRPIKRTLRVQLRTDPFFAQGGPGSPPWQDILDLVRTCERSLPSGGGKLV